MILYKGEIYPNEKQGELIASLKGDMLLTLEKGETLSYLTVIDACDRLYQRVMNHEFDDVAMPLLNAINMPFSALDR